MNDHQKRVVQWFLATNTAFVSAIVELEGGFESVPDDVFNAFDRLPEREQVEVIQFASTAVLGLRKVTTSNDVYQLVNDKVYDMEWNEIKEDTGIPMFVRQIDSYNRMDVDIARIQECLEAYQQSLPKSI